MHRGLPWAGGVSAKSATDGSGAPSYTRISSSYSSMISLLLLARRHELYQLVIYMHEMMMQHLVIRQQQLLK